MSDLLANVLIAAARGIVQSVDQGGKTPAPAGKPAVTTTATAPGKPATPPATGKPAAGKPAAATGKPAAAAGKPAAGKPAAGKPAAPAAKPQVGKYSEDQVRALVRQVAQHEALGKQEALNILDEEAGVQNVSALKPADYDKVAEACNNALRVAGGQGTGEEETASEEFDPTA